MYWTTATLPSCHVSACSGTQVLTNACVVQEFVGKLDLKADERVLDVGCGIGGGDFYMAAEYGAFVHGLDLSSNMVLIGLERTATTAGAAKVRCTASGLSCLVHAACLCSAEISCDDLCSRGLV